MNRRVNAELAEAFLIAYYKDLIAPQNGGCACCERIYAHLTTSDQHDEPQG
jgi:hypothetical protein